MGGIYPAPGRPIIPGQVIPYAGATIPTGYLLCDGQAVSRTTYAKLFTAIGTIWGTGNGTTTFNIPDLRDVFPVGAGPTRPLAGSGGEAAHTLTLAELPASGGTVSTRDYDFGDHATEGQDSGRVANAANAGGPGQSFQLPLGGGQAHNTMPPYRALNFIIAV